MLLLRKMAESFFIFYSIGLFSQLRISQDTITIVEENTPSKKDSIYSHLLFVSSEVTITNIDQIYINNTSKKISNKPIKGKKTTYIKEKKASHKALATLHHEIKTSEKISSGNDSYSHIDITKDINISGFLTNYTKGELFIKNAIAIAGIGNRNNEKVLHDKNSISTDGNNCFHKFTRPPPLLFYI